MPGNKDMELGSLAQLIIDAQSGDPKYQEELYERFKPMIFKMTRSISSNDREDARQELTYELFLAAKRFRPFTN